MMSLQQESAGPDGRVEQLRAMAHTDREEAIGELIAHVARPRAERLLRRLSRGGGVGREDEEDILATVLLRLLTKLRAAAASADEPIERLEDYVTGLTYNALNDHLRRRFPQRTRLKNRLRYTLTRDARLALWTADGRLVCGRAEWRGTPAAMEEPPPLHDLAARRIRNRARPAEALLAFFDHCVAPLPLEALVDAMAELWHVLDAPPAAPALRAREASAELTSEWRQLLARLWQEIVQLRPMQRKALLLNLREAEASHALSLFVLTGIASFEAIAAAVEMTPAALEAVWNELPFDDLRIAGMLDLTRQQVINLRKSARERLTRRLAQARTP